jgi:hypothetical protein
VAVRAGEATSGLRPCAWLDWFLVLVAAAAVAAYLAVYTIPLADAPIRSDGYSYYVYLPSWFLHHDLTLDSVARDCCGGTFPAFTAIRRWPTTNRWLDPHPIGVALMMSPFFVAANLLTRWSNLPPDGFSLYYQHAAGLAGLAAFLGGLVALSRVLIRHFSPGIALAALTTITFGTNLFHYGVYESTFSHAFSFLLIALLVDLSDRWFATPDVRTSLPLALVSGLIVLTRHPNALFLLIVPLADPREFWARRRLVLGMAAIGGLTIAPQLLIYRLATGRWLVSAYEQAGAFNFGSPHIWGVLFGVQKGLFFWSPVLLFAVAGFFVPTPWTHRFRLSAAIVFLTVGYLIASWSDWQFGASYGHRGFTDGLPLAAIFLASFFDWVSDRPWLTWALGIGISLLVLLSTAQMIQYWLGILPIANTTWSEYRALFLRFR